MSEIGRMLAGWLNGERDSSPSYERVSRLIEGLHGLEPLLREHPVAEANQDGTTTFLDTSPGALLRDAINESLARYKFKPTLITTGVQNVRVKWLSTDETGEAAMIDVVCELYKDGLLALVRECSCGKWFMARSNNQECCSTGCRQKRYGKTDKGRAKGKQVSRAHYNKEQRQPKLKAVQAAIQQWPARPSAATKADWQQWIIGKIKPKTLKITRSFLSRAVKRGEIAPPV